MPTSQRAPAPVTETKDFVDAAFPGRSSLYVHEVAAHLAVSETHVRDLIVDGRLPGAFNIGNSSRKSWRIPLAALKHFIQQSTS